MSTATKMTKKKAVPGSKAGSSPKRVEANRRNAQTSTGPRTDEGKERSKYNALSHGQTARSTLLPGEDPAALNALRREMLDDLQPRNSLEATLIVQIADDKWITNRSEQSAGKRLAQRLRHEPLEQAKSEKDEALELGENLFWNLARPLPFDASSMSLPLGEPPVGDVAVHPIHAARVRLRLEQTVAGCDWLLDRWYALHDHLNVQNAWLASDAFKMVRLMGKHSIDMDEDFDVARMLMSSLIVIGAQNTEQGGKPVDWSLALMRMLSSYEFEGRESSTDSVLGRCVSFRVRLGQLPLARMAPESAIQAREWLSSLIDGEIRRIQEIRAKLQGIADLDAAEAPDRLWFETGPEGENHRRYVLSHKRVLNRSIGMLLTARTKAESGAFDRAEAVPHEPAQAADLPAADVFPASTPMAIAGNDCLGGGADAAARPGCDRDRPERFVERGEAANGEKLLSVSDAANGGCGDKQILRNEPISSVAIRPLSVVRGELEVKEKPAPTDGASPASDLDARLAAIFGAGRML
jgi:hypothetical protein